MNLRIGGFEEHPGPTGGRIYLWLNDTAIEYVDTSNYIKREQVTAALIDRIEDAGFTVECATGIPVNATLVTADPSGDEITQVVLQLQDPALVTSDLRFLPGNAGDPPRPDGGDPRFIP